MFFLYRFELRKIFNFGLILGFEMIFWFDKVFNVFWVRNGLTMSLLVKTLGTLFF